MASLLLNNLVFSFKQILEKLFSKKAESAEQKSQSNKKQDLGSHTFLIVDDDDFSKFVFANYIKRWNGNVEIADTGLSALEMIKVKKYDIILMDIQMPAMDGIEATENIRRMNGTYFKKVPILAVTALSTSNIKQRLITAGFDDCLTKEIKADEFYEKLVYFLNKSKGLAQPN